MGPEGGDPRAAYVPQVRDYGVPGEIITSYADFLSILAGYDKRGVNPLGSSLRWPSAAKRRLSRRNFSEGGPA